MSESVLDIKGLSVTLNKKAILHDITFSVKRGERLSIVGPNGAGKTTLLRCLGGLLEPSSGEIHVEGRPLGAYRARDLARRISYVPQAEGRMLPYTAYEFVLMARYPHLGPLSGVSAEDRAAARQALQETDTAHLAERSLDTLSGGERQKVFMAAALAQGASMVLLDEPLTFLDYRHQVEVLGLIHRLCQAEHRTVLCVTHDLNKGVYESDRILALKRGRIEFLGKPEELFVAERLASIYETPFDLITYAETGHPHVIPIDAEAKGGVL